MRRVVLLSGVVGVAIVQRRRLVALLTKTTGTWVGTPPVTEAAEATASEAPRPETTAP